jgi:hypothetical protein
VTDTAEPIVTVLMSVRNGERYLDDAVGSILGQTLSDIELLVVDDGSTDESLSMLQAHAANDARVRVETQPGRGVAVALNRGLATARGRYVARMDADDISVTDRLAQQVSLLERDPTLVLVGSCIDVLDAGGSVVARLDHPSAPDAVREQLLDGNCIVHPTVVFRTDAVRDAGGYRSAFVHAEDYDLWLRLSETYRLANVQQRLLGYRVHPCQVTSDNLAEQAMSAIAARVVAKIRRAGAEEPVLPERVDLSFLRKLGVSDNEIAREIAANAITWSGMFAGISTTASEDALRQARLALSSLADNGAGLALLARREARVALRAGRTVAAVRAVATAVRRDRGSLAAALRSVRRGSLTRD